MRIRQSFCYPMFRPKEMPLDKLFKTAAGIGYAATEFWAYGDDVGEIVDAAKRSGLAVASVSGHASRTDGLNNRANHDRIEHELRRSIDLAVKFGIPGLICLTGNRLEGASDQEGIDATADCLKRAAPYAEEKGINLNLELLNTVVDHAGYEGNHVAWGLEVLDKVASPRVKLLFDIYHMQIMDGNIIQTIRQNIGRIGHFHTAGVPGRKDLDDTQELNYGAICRAIAATGYDLFVGHEFRPRAGGIEGLRSAFAVCDQDAQPAEGG